MNEELDANPEQDHNAELKEKLLYIAEKGANEDKAGARQLYDTISAPMPDGSARTVSPETVDFVNQKHYALKDSLNDYTTPEEVRAKYDRRYQQNQDAQRKLDYVIEQNGDDAALAKDTAYAQQLKDNLINRTSVFDKMNDANAGLVMQDVDTLYNEAKGRRGALEKLWDGFTRGYLDTGAMMAQGGMMFKPGELTDEDVETVKGLNDVRQQNAIENPAGDVQSIRDVKSLSDLGGYIGNLAAEQTPRTLVQMAGSAAGAIVGGVPGAIIGGSLATILQNTGEAVGDQIDDNVKFSRPLAIAQGTGYSLLDGALGIVPGLAKVWQQVLKMAGKDVAKNLTVEAAKSATKLAVKKNALVELGKMAAEEGVTETLQSGLIGRGRRYLQTGSMLAEGETHEDALWSQVDELAGGTILGGIMGGGGVALGHANAKRALNINRNVVQNLVDTKEFNDLAPEYQMLVGRKIMLDALSATTGVYEDRDLAAMRKASDDIEEALKTEDSTESKAARIVLNAVRDTSSAEDLDSVLERAGVQDGQTVMNIDAAEMEKTAKPNLDADGNTVGMQYTDPGSGIAIYETKDRPNGPSKFSVVNAAQFKDPIGQTGVFDNLQDAFDYAGKLKIYDTQLMKEADAKVATVKGVFEKMYGMRGISAVPLWNVRGTNLAGTDSPAYYDEGANTLYVAVDRLKSLGQLYTVLAHELGHKDIADALTGKDTSKTFGNGKVRGAKDKIGTYRTKLDTIDMTKLTPEEQQEVLAQKEALAAEEYLVEMASVVDINKALQDMDRGIVSAGLRKLFPALARKMGSDMAVPTDYITDADVRAELAFLNDHGYLGKTTNSQATMNDANEMPEQSASYARQELQNQQIADERRAIAEQGEALAREEVALEKGRIEAQKRDYSGDQLAPTADTEMPDTAAAGGTDVQQVADQLVEQRPDMYEAYLKDRGYTDDASSRKLFYNYYVESQQNGTPMLGEAVSKTETAEPVAQNVQEPAQDAPQAIAESETNNEVPKAENAPEAVVEAPVEEAPVSEQAKAEPVETQAEEAPVEQKEEEETDTAEAAYQEWLATKKDGNGKPMKDNASARQLYAQHLRQQEEYQARVKTITPEGFRGWLSSGRKVGRMGHQSAQLSKKLFTDLVGNGLVDGKTGAYIGKKEAVKLGDDEPLNGRKDVPVKLSEQKVDKVEKVAEPAKEETPAVPETSALDAQKAKIEAMPTDTKKQQDAKKAAQKDWLLSSIDAAIAKHGNVDVSDVVAMREKLSKKRGISKDKQELDANNLGKEKIVFDVPDDGTFTINDSPYALTIFKHLVQKRLTPTRLKDGTLFKAEKPLAEDVKSEGIGEKTAEPAKAPATFQLRDQVQFQHEGKTLTGNVAAVNADGTYTVQAQTKVPRSAANPDGWQKVRVTKAANELTAGIANRGLTNAERKLLKDSGAKFKTGNESPLNPENANAIIPTADQVRGFINGLEDGSITYPRFKPEEVKASNGENHEKLWDIILRLERFKLHAGAKGQGAGVLERAGDASLGGDVSWLGKSHAGSPAVEIGRRLSKIGRGVESDVFDSGDGSVIKVRKISFIGANGLIDHLARIVYHNYLFPQDSYQLLDLVRNDNGKYHDFYLILRQKKVVPLVENGTTAAPSDGAIKEALNTSPMKFETIGASNPAVFEDDVELLDSDDSDIVPVSARFEAYNGDFALYDFKPGENTFVDSKTGAIRFIDPRVDVNDPGDGHDFSKFGSRKRYDGGLIGDIGKFMFKTEAKLSDPTKLFGADESQEVHELGYLKEIARRPTSDEEMNRMALAIVDDPPKMEQVFAKALDDTPMSAAEIHAMVISQANDIIALDMLRSTMTAQTGRDRALEEEALEKAIERKAAALYKAKKQSGSSLRVLQIGVGLDAFRDTLVYMEKQMGATKAKQGLDPTLNAQEKELAKRYADALKEANKKLVSLAAREKQAQDEAARLTAELEIARKRGENKVFRMSEEAAKTVKEKYGVSFKEKDMEAWQAAVRRFGTKNLKFKNGTPVALDEEMRNILGQIVSTMGFDNAAKMWHENFGAEGDAIFNQFKNEIESQAQRERAPVEKKVKERGEKFVKSTVRPRSVRLPKVVTLEGLKADLDAQRAAVEKDLYELTGEEQRKALGGYLRSYMNYLVSNDPQMTNDAVFQTMADEANALMPGAGYDAASMVYVLTGQQGFDVATRAAIDQRLKNLNAALKKAQEGKLTEAAKLAGVTYRPDIELLDAYTDQLGKLINKKQDKLAEILANPLPDEQAQVDEIARLKQELADLGESIASMRTDIAFAQKREKYLNALKQQKDALAETKRQLQDGTYTDAQKAAVERDIDEVAQALKYARSEVNTLKAIQRQIDRWQQKLDAQDFEEKPAVRKPVEAKSVAIRQAMDKRDKLRKEFNRQQRNYQYKKLSAPVKFLKDIWEILGESKAVIGSLDMSSILRQGGQLTFAHPLLFAKNFIPTFKAYLNGNTADQMLASIKARPNWKYMEKAGVEVTDWGIEAENADDRFVLNHYRKITRLKLLRMGVEASERAFSMYLNLMRADVFDALVNSSTFGGPQNMTDSQLKAVGNFINIASQRGAIDKMSKLGKAMELANVALWSPRNMISRFQFLKETVKLALPGFDPYGDRTLRKLFAKELARYLGGMAAMIAFAKFMADLFRGDDEPEADMVFDPRSSKFLRVKFGNTYVDFLSGLAQIFTAGSRILTKSTVDARGNVKPADWYSVFGKFIRSKASPLAGFVADTLTGETFGKKDITLSPIWEENEDQIGVLRYLKDTLSPLVINDVIEQGQQSGIPNTVLTGMLTFLGAGAQAYDPNTYKQMKGDFYAYRRMYDDSHDPDERQEILRRHPILTRRGKIEQLLTLVRKWERIIKDLGKRGVSESEIEKYKNLLTAQKEQAKNVMAGLD